MKIIIFFLALATCISFVSAQDIFKGGNADGWASNSFLQPSNNIFNGGNGYGWVSNSFLQPSNNIFTGGNGDGWSVVKTFTGSSVYVCAAGSSSIPAVATGNSYQWEVNTGIGFIDISNGTNYNGVSTNSLVLINIPASFYGYQYRCLINGSPGAIYTLKIAAYWTGVVNTAWETTGNWGCGVLPDANTDVFIFGGKNNYPLINSNVSCRSISANNGTSVTVITGKTITLTGNE